MPSIVTPSASSSSCAWVTWPIGAGAVGANDAGPRQLELALELAVVGEEQQPLGHEIEPADRHQPRQPGGKPVVDRRPPLRIVCGGDRRPAACRSGYRRVALAGRTGRTVDRDAATSSSKVAGVVSFSPLSAIRPSAIMRSISRREAIPARASSLAMRCGPPRAFCGVAGTVRRRWRRGGTGRLFVRCGGEVMVGVKDAVREA